MIIRRFVVGFAIDPLSNGPVIVGEVTTVNRWGPARLNDNEAIAHLRQRGATWGETRVVAEDDVAFCVGHWGEAPDGALIITEEDSDHG